MRMHNCAGKICDGPSVCTHKDPLHFVTLPRHDVVICLTTIFETNSDTILINNTTTAHQVLSTASTQMGLRMDQLHAPTVASGATSSQQNGDKKQMSVQELIAEKDRVWGELSALGSVLDSVCLLFFAFVHQNLAKCASLLGRLSH